MIRRLLTLCAVTLAAAGLVSQARGAIETNIRFSEDVAAFTCGGEVVDVHVDVHLLTRVGQDAQGVAHLGSTMTAFFHGTSADGDRYIGTSHSTMQRRGDFDVVSTHTLTFNVNVILLGENGTGDDLSIRGLFHVTFNPDGELVSSNLDFTSSCD